MQRNASALPFLLALAITRAHGEALFTDPIATNSANAPLIWLNRETTAATTLTLTREPDGGDTIAVIPRGGSITALMRDADGHTLAKTPFGITGWAQAQAKPSPRWRCATTTRSTSTSTTTPNSANHRTTTTTTTKPSRTPPRPACRPTQRRTNRRRITPPTTACSKPHSKRTARATTSTAQPAPAAITTACF